MKTGASSMVGSGCVSSTDTSSLNLTLDAINWAIKKDKSFVPVLLQYFKAAVDRVGDEN